jgi:hypothetical protein
MKFIKKKKNDDEVHSVYEIVSELFSSRLGIALGLPVLELKLVGEGLEMEYLPDSLEVNKISNLKQLQVSLPFEEWLLNIDLKEDHVRAKDGKGYIIDHGHTLLSWKPLYYVMQIIDKPVTRFKLWSDKESFYEGVEIINSIDCHSVKVLLNETLDEVHNFYPLNNDAYKDFMEISYKILQHRKKIIKNLFI